MCFSFLLKFKEQFLLKLSFFCYMSPIVFWTPHLMKRVFITYFLPLSFSSVCRLQSSWQLEQWQLGLNKKHCILFFFSKRWLVASGQTINHSQDWLYLLTGLQICFNINMNFYINNVSKNLQITHLICQHLQTFHHIRQLSNKTSEIDFWRGQSKEFGNIGPQINLL